MKLVIVLRAKNKIKNNEKEREWDEGAAGDDESEDIVEEEYKVHYDSVYAVYSVCFHLGT
jgi:Rieske Fe-S protein